MGVVIGIFITLLAIATTVNLLSSMDNHPSFLRRLIMYKGFITKYGEVFKELGVSVKPYNHDRWKKTEYDDYKIKIIVANKKERRSGTFEIFVDSYGNLSDEDEEKELLEIIKNKI